MCLVCVWRMWGNNACDAVNVGSSEGKFVEWILSFHVSVGSGDRTQAVRLAQPLTSPKYSLSFPFSLHLLCFNMKSLCLFPFIYISTQIGLVRHKPTGLPDQQRSIIKTVSHSWATPNWITLWWKVRFFTYNPFHRCLLFKRVNQVREMECAGCLLILRTKAPCLRRVITPQRSFWPLNEIKQDNLSQTLELTHAI